jgi:hypothetical protein
MTITTDETTTSTAELPADQYNFFTNVSEDLDYQFSFDFEITGDDAEVSLQVDALAYDRNFVSGDFKSVRDTTTLPDSTTFGRCGVYVPGRRYNFRGYIYHKDKELTDSEIVTRPALFSSSDTDFNQDAQTHLIFKAGTVYISFGILFFDITPETEIKIYNPRVLPLGHGRTAETASGMGFLDSENHMVIYMKVNAAKGFNQAILDAKQKLLPFNTTSEFINLTPPTP